METLSPSSADGYENPPNLPDEYEREPVSSSEEELQLRATCFRVMKSCCDHCLFGPQKLVSDARKVEILEQCERQERAFFVCHVASKLGQMVCCRAFYERYKDQLPSLQLVQACGRISPDSLRFVDPHGGGEQDVDVP